MLHFIIKTVAVDKSITFSKFNNWGSLQRAESENEDIVDIRRGKTNINYAKYFIQI